MERLKLTAVECKYQELDRQLKEQFINGLIDKEVLGEIIKELTTTTGSDIITSENILSWAKRVEVQRAQSAVMSTITETKDVIKLEYLSMPTKTAPEGQHSPACHQNRYAGTVAAHIYQDNAWHMGRCLWSAARLATSKKYVGAGGPGL